ncbi:Histidine kinase-like ATPase domain-containing protein [Lentzea jiangxiensis]|uniref:Histidine kinase-like ATPase domain-containing protein n=1 Tax=Lentzea jiangxiensis TaxID=641025 RepID=A0A1H0WD73_9PSEU|nr:Histidine kinase-like ATPase domain-containing protein [Lentzea jiangxiensis]
MPGSAEGRPEFILNVDLTGGAAPPLRDLRHSVRRALSHLHADCVGDAELLVTELISNAYDHGRPPISFRMCELPGSALRIDVEDGDRANLPRLGVSRLGGGRGRGLVLVKELSRRWGCVVTATSKIVWAEMNCRVLSPVRPA